MPTPDSSNLVERAREYATAAHGRIEQRRKYTRDPYEVHLRAVAECVAAVTDDPVLVAAAWLHDAVEDTPATIEDVERAFGRAVAAIVADLTDPSRPGDGNRPARKAIERAHLARASSGAQTVKLADLIDNCRSIAAHDPDFAAVYLAEAEDLLAVLERGDAALRRRLVRTLARCRESLGRRGAVGAPAPAAEAPLAAIDRDLLARHHRSLCHFMQAFAAADLAEPLVLLDADAPASAGIETLRRVGADVAGVRAGGEVVGRVHVEDLRTGTVAEHARAFRRDQLLDARAALVDVVHALTRNERCFVRHREEVDGVIERADLQRPIGRMWLFGIVTFTEAGLRERVARRWPADAWTERLSATRLAAACALRDERARVGQSVALLDCLQLADLGRILLGDPEERAAFGFESRAAGDRVLRELQSLRNNLAHAQDIVTHDWAQIARMSRRLAQIASVEP